MARSPRPPVASCDQHTVRITAYLAHFDDNHNRQKRGERQVQCEECGLWVWPLDTSHIDGTVPTNKG